MNTRWNLMILGMAAVLGTPHFCLSNEKPKEPSSPLTEAIIAYRTSTNEEQKGEAACRLAEILSDPAKNGGNWEPVTNYFTEALALKCPRTWDVFLKRLEKLDSKNLQKIFATIRKAAVEENKKKWALQMLLRTIENPNPEIRKLAFRNVGDIACRGNQTAVSALASEKNDHLSGARAMRFRELEKAAVKGCWIALSALIQETKSDKESLKRAAYIALGNVAAMGNKRALRKILQATKSANKEKIQMGILGLEKAAASGNAEATEILLQILENRDSNIRNKTILALGEPAAKGNKEILKTLLNLARSEDLVLRRATIPALQHPVHHGDQEALEALVKLAGDENSIVAHAAIGALRNSLRKSGKTETLKTVLTLAKNPNPNIRQAMISPLGHAASRGNKKALYALHHLAGDPTPAVRSAAQREMLFWKLK